MAWIELDRVAVGFPIADGSSMSLKRTVAAIVRRLGTASIPHGRPRVVQALRDISLNIKDGDRVGLIGPNGGGKTTLLRVVAGAYEPTHGEVRICGRVTSLIDLALGFDLEATGYENIYLRGYTLGMSSSTIRGSVAGIAEFADLGDRLNDPVRTYSAGMMLRLAFATSLMCPHDILLLDEVIGVGDAAFLAKARDRLTGAIRLSRIMILASHALDVIEGFCNKAIYLRDGRVAAFGPVRETISVYHRDLAGGEPLH